MNTTTGKVLTIAAFALLFTSNIAAAIALDGNQLTLTKLRNGSYQIANGACGATVVKLHNGHGSAQGVDVVFHRAVFGKLTTKHQNGAVCHISYKDEMFGWMQQVLFVVERDGKILQIAEIGLDERETLSNIEVRDGQARIETTSPDIVSGKVYKRCIQATLIQGKEGCELTAHEFDWLTTDKDHQESSRLASLR